MSQTKAQLISDLVQALNFTGTSSHPANGMYLSAANTISLSTNSTAARLTIDSSGDATFGGSVTVSNDVLKLSGGGHTKIQIETTGTTHATGIQIKHASGNGAEQTWQIQTDGSADGDLKLRNATAGTDAIIVDPTNNATFKAPCTINSGTNTKLILSGSNDPQLKLYEGTTSKVQLQWDSTNGLVYFWNEETNTGFQFGAVSKWYDGSAYQVIWHAGNDGSGSGLDADTCDGQHLATDADVQFGRLNAQKGITTAPSLLIGANSGGSGMNNNSSKHANICCPQYLSDTQTGGFRLLSAYGNDGANYCYIGGNDDNITGTATHPKNATELRLFTSATATGNGIQRIRIDSSGRVIIGGGAHSGGANLVVKGIDGETPNSYAAVAFCKIGANPTSDTSLVNLRFSGGATGTNRAAEITVKTDSNWNDGTSQESKMVFTVASSNGGNTAGNPLLTLKGTGDVEVNRGNLVLADTKGIDFSASEGGTGTSNESSLLADYEEGTFALNESTISVSNYGTRYVKIGKMVYLTGRIVFGASSDTGIVNMTGIPFAPNTDVNNSAQAGYVGESSIGSTPLAICLETSSSHFRLRVDNITALNRSQVSTDSIRFNLWYLAAA